MLTQDIRSFIPGFVTDTFLIRFAIPEKTCGEIFCLYMRLLKA
jgi:hypothetical protein